MSRWLAAAAIMAAVGLGVGALGFAYLEARLPDVFSFSAYRRIALESTRIHASGGELIGRFGAENRTVVTLEHMPRTLLFATVCAEDAAFFHHPGLDVAGIARALWVDLVSGRMAQGASTITQQFAKTRFLSREKTLSRKLKELVLSRKLEHKLSKNDILAMYLNEIYFGHGRYGVEEAARYYFGKPAAELDLAESAMLAGIINNPGRLSPFRSPGRATKRRAYVLDQMQRRGYISANDVARAAREPLPDKPHDRLALAAPYYVSEVRRRLRELVGAATLTRGGLRVEVGLDVVAQRAAQGAVARGLKGIDRRYRTARALRHYDTEASLAAGLERLRRALGKRPPRDGRIRLGVVLGPVGGSSDLELDLGDEKGTLPRAQPGRYPRKWSRGDLLRVRVLRRQEGRPVLTAEGGPQAALVAIEPRTRLVRALVGGDDFALHPFNRALRARRQPGSTFKTFVYGAGIEAGTLTLDTELRDEKRTWISGGRPWTPRNYSGRWDGELHSVREALARSINSIAVAVADRVGPERVIDFAHRAGITSPLRADLPLALGASSVTPLELANAYATIAAGGLRAAPVLITRIVDRDGRVLYTAQPRPQRAIAPEVATALADALGEVMRTGSGRSAAVGRPVAGKTGTTNRGRDAWFAGFSRQLCAVVWVGHDDRKPMPHASGGRLALPIWADFMRGALARVAAVPLPRLPHVVTRRPLPATTPDQDEGAADADTGPPYEIEDEVLEDYGAGL